MKPLDFSNAKNLRVTDDDAQVVLCDMELEDGSVVPVAITSNYDNDTALALRNAVLNGDVSAEVVPSGRDLAYEKEALAVAAELDKMTSKERDAKLAAAAERVKSNNGVGTQK